jgi:hypothetical protein
MLPFSAASRCTPSGSTTNWFLLVAGLYISASSCHPSGGSIGAFVGQCIEGNRRTRGSFTNGVGLKPASHLQPGENEEM